MTTTDTAKTIETVTTHKADQDVRVCRRIEIGRVAAHQGDVYVHRVADDQPRGKPWGTKQVAVGNQVGARHVAEGEDVHVYAGDPSSAAALMPKFSDDQREACLGPVVVAKSEWTLTHPEHAHHRLPAGTYQVTYQWDAQTMARVAD